MNLGQPIAARGDFAGVLAGARLPAQFAAAFELAGLLTALAGSALCFLAGGLDCDQAAVVTLGLLLGLLGLAWLRFEGGRHPCFFFLCLLTLFQAGRPLGYCLGGESGIFRVALLTAHPFDVSRQTAGLTLLCLAISAVCLYAPCRWFYRPVAPAVAPPADAGAARYLPYLYWLFAVSVPVQLYKNFCYYRYARERGGYLSLFLDHGGMAASVPLGVRVVALTSLPALIGVLILEPRKGRRRGAMLLYFAMAAPLLALGSRGAVFSLALALCYLAKVKSGGRTRLVGALALAAALALAGAAIGWLRAGGTDGPALAGPARFVADQGGSLDVTSVTIAYRREFAPHIVSYLAGELRLGFVTLDQSHYRAGRHLADDMSMFLNPAAYRMGAGSGSSYLAEAYLAGGVAGVAVVSALLGAVLAGMHRLSRHPLGLFLVVLVLPDVLLMTRGDLLAWVSVAARAGIVTLVLAAGWLGYRGLAAAGRASGGQENGMGGNR